MIRRFGAALIGLALCLPVFAVPVAATTNSTFLVVHTTYTDGLNTHVIGTVESHFPGRRASVAVTATWRQGTTVTEAVTAPAFLTNLAPHAKTPFHITVVTADTVPSDTLTVTAASAAGSAPAGALDVDTATINDGTPDTVTGNVINDGSATAANVKVYALVLNAGVMQDAGESVAIPTLLSGGNSAYTITLTRNVAASDQLYMVARSTTGASLFTSWNNFFGDLGNTSESFIDEIAWMADQGITTGCSTTSFCPKANVPRWQMAVFLNRALTLTPAADQGFTDLAGLSASVVQAINNIAAAGITGGCNATPKEYCPGDFVTRGQMSTFIVRGYGLAPIPGAGIFTDDNGHFSEPYNNRMAANGITGGCAATKYCPHANVLREQMAVFIFRAENP